MNHRHRRELPYPASEALFPRSRIAIRSWTIDQFWAIIAMRVRLSLTVRPWLTDIGCGISTIFWGLWVGIHHEQVALHSGFDLFEPILREMSIFAFVLGILQLTAALLKMGRTRQLVALIAAIMWSGIAMGLNSYSGQAAYAGYTFLNFLILTRRF